MVITYGNLQDSLVSRPSTAGVDPFTHAFRCVPRGLHRNGAMAAAAWPFGRWQRLASLLPSGWLKLCGLGVLLSFCWRWRIWRRVLKLWLSSIAYIAM